VVFRKIGEDKLEVGRIALIEVLKAGTAMTDEGNSRELVMFEVGALAIVVLPMGDMVETVIEGKVLVALTWTATTVKVVALAEAKGVDKIGATVDVFESVRTESVEEELAGQEAKVEAGALLDELTGTVEDERIELLEIAVLDVKVLDVKVLEVVGSGIETVIVSK